VHPKKFRPARTITAFAILSTLLSANYPSPTQAKTAPAAADTTPFLGTWTAYHSGTPIILVHISPASNGALAGTVQVCSYTISEASGKVDVVTDPTLSAESKIDNVKIDSVTAISFT